VVRVDDRYDNLVSAKTVIAGSNGASQFGNANTAVPATGFPMKVAERKVVKMSMSSSGALNLTWR